MQQEPAPPFLNSFIGSFVSIPNHPQYTKRTGWSFLAHFMLLMVLCCSFYALISTVWLNQNFSPILEELAQKTPDIQFVEGKAKVDIEQPYLVKEDDSKQVVAIIDTSKDPMGYLEEYKGPLLVMGEEALVSRDNRGKVEMMKYSDIHADFSINSQMAMGWVKTLQSWFLPATFLLCMVWQVAAKSFEVLVIAGVVTLYQSSRPDFSTHLKLATLALGPAVAFSFVAYLMSMFFFSIPMSSLLFWVILGAITVSNSERMRSTPQHS